MLAFLLMTIRSLVVRLVAVRTLFALSLRLCCSWLGFGVSGVALRVHGADRLRVRVLNTDARGHDCKPPPRDCLETNSGAKGLSNGQNKCWVAAQKLPDYHVIWI